jgi:hypothetical protein
MNIPVKVSNETIYFPRVIYFSKNIMMIGIRIEAGQYRNHWPARIQSTKNSIKGVGDNHHGDQGYQARPNWSVRNANRHAFLFSRPGGQHRRDRRRRAAQAVDHDPGLGQAENEIADDLRAFIVGVEGENGGAGLQMHGRLRIGLGS